MQEISPTNVISILQQQSKKKQQQNQGRKIHCVQHIENLKALIQKEKIKKTCLENAKVMQTHLENSHKGVKNINIQDINNLNAKDF